MSEEETIDPEQAIDRIEEASGRPVITEKKATQLNEVVTGMIEGISDIKEKTEQS